MELTVNQWKKILSDSKLTNELDLSIFQALYAFEGYRAYASQIGDILGKDYRVLNLEIGRYAKRIQKQYGVTFSKRANGKDRYWDFFFNGWEEGKYFVWQLKPNLIKALEESNLTNKFQFAEELEEGNSEVFIEGLKKRIVVNAYERNPKAREKCIEHYGTKCFICGFDFQEQYGEIGKGFIHVHHLIPISEIGKTYRIDPINDLRPVCPNCHSMLHKETPPIKIEELKRIIKKKEG